MKRFLILCIVIMSFTALSSFANSLKNSEFMALSEGQRYWWYGGAFTAFGHAVLMDTDDGEKARCVWKWYFDEPERRQKQLEKSFKKYPDHTPTSIAIALLRRDCGVFPAKGS